MKNTSVMSFNRFNHGPNFNPHGQYDYINPVKISDDNIHSPNIWDKLWEFNLTAKEISRSLRTFHIQFDLLDLLDNSTISPIHFDVSMSYQTGTIGFSCSKHYNAVNINTVNPLESVNLHLFYKKVDDCYQIKIYLKALPGSYPVLYNARFWNMLGYDSADPQFYPSSVRTNAAQLQQTKWFMTNVERNWTDGEHVLSDTEGFEHVIAATVPFKTGRNLLKGTLDFNADNWQVPANSLETIGDTPFFHFTQPNQVPFNLNQTVTLTEGHNYTFSFDAKAAKRALINFEIYAIGVDSGDVSYKPISFMIDTDIKRYAFSFKGTGKKVKRFQIKPALTDGQSLSDAGGGVWLGRYTLSDAAFDEDWHPYAAE